MPLWLWILLGIPVGMFATYFLLLAVTARKSSAGIVTSRLGRTVRLYGDAVSMTSRYARRKIRRLFTSKAKRAALDQRYHEATAKAALETMGNMKGALMKLGQIISFMDESLPEAYQEQLRKLQTSAPPMDYDTVVRVIRAELGKEPEQLFARFDKKPLASASIGQVHRAALHDGTEVAVKIQYPGVDKAIAADLDNYGMLMGIAGAVTPTLDAKPIVDELRSRLLEELDYRIEAKNQQHFIDLFKGHPTIVIPRVFPERSAQRVITTEFINGIGFYDFVAKADKETQRKSVLTIREFVFDSIWFHNTFNGDPHPGNYLFMPDGRVAFLDFGCVKHFDPKFISDFQVLNRAYLTGDRDGYFAKACDMKFIKAGHEHKVGRDWLYDYARWFYLPILEDAEFEFTPDYCKKAISVIFGENMRLLNMPPEYVMLNRITFGLNSIMSRLGAKENWRRLSMHYYFQDGHVPPPMETTPAPAPVIVATGPTTQPVL
jgi:predicted unusual protein kinase regulating ubiquinone biosynthesis (AarF/ABC1/UbiB family)